eukprot:666943-Hanusia_phi.AAC.6
MQGGQTAGDIEESVPLHNDFDTWTDVNIPANAPPQSAPASTSMQPGRTLWRSSCALPVELPFPLRREEHSKEECGECATDLRAPLRSISETAVPFDCSLLSSAQLQACLVNLDLVDAVPADELLHTLHDGEAEHGEDVPPTLLPHVLALVARDVELHEPRERHLLHVLLRQVVEALVPELRELGEGLRAVVDAGDDRTERGDLGVGHRRGEHGGRELLGEAAINPVDGLPRPAADGVGEADEVEPDVEGVHVVHGDAGEAVLPRLLEVGGEAGPAPVHLDLLLLHLQVEVLLRRHVDLDVARKGRRDGDAAEDRDRGLVVVLRGVALVPELGGELEAARPDVAPQDLVEVALHGVVARQAHDVEQQVDLDDVLAPHVVPVGEAHAPQQRLERVEADQPLRLHLHLVVEVEAPQERQPAARVAEAVGVGLDDVFPDPGPVHEGHLPLHGLEDALVDHLVLDRLHVGDEEGDHRRGQVEVDPDVAARLDVLPRHLVDQEPPRGLLHRVDLRAALRLHGPAPGHHHRHAQDGPRLAVGPARLQELDPRFRGLHEPQGARLPQRTHVDIFQSRRARHRGRVLDVYVHLPGEHPGILPQAHHTLDAVRQLPLEALYLGHGRPRLAHPLQHVQAPGAPRDHPHEHLVAGGRLDATHLLPLEQRHVVEQHARLLVAVGHGVLQEVAEDHGPRGQQVGEHRLARGQQHPPPHADVGALHVVDVERDHHTVLRKPGGHAPLPVGVVEGLVVDARLAGDALRHAEQVE